jgi:hypothetical protein
MSSGMPGQGKLARLLERGATSTAVVRRVFVEAGRVRVDCYDAENSTPWFGLAVLQAGGGGPDDFASTPPREPTIPLDVRYSADDSDTTQVLLLHRPKKKPIVIGAVEHPGSSILDATPVVAQDADHPGSVGKQDFAWARGGARLIVDARGAVTIAPGGEDGNARIQLPADGVLRISRDGQAEERLLLAGPVFAYLQEVDAYLSAVDIWAKALATDPSTGVVVTPLVAARPTLPAAGSLKAAGVAVSRDAETP